MLMVRLPRDHHACPPARRTSPGHTRLFISCALGRKAGRPLPRTPPQAATLPLPHTRRTDVTGSICPLRKQTAYRWPDNKATRHRIWEKPGVESSLLNPESQHLLCSPTHSRASLPPIPWPWAPAHSIPRSSLATRHHRGQLPPCCPLQGLESTLRRALPSCGQPVGLLAPGVPWLS